MNPPIGNGFWQARNKLKTKTIAKGVGILSCHRELRENTWKISMDDFSTHSTHRKRTKSKNANKTPAAMITTAATTTSRTEARISRTATPQHCMSMRRHAPYTCFLRNASVLVCLVVLVALNIFGAGFIGVTAAFEQRENTRVLPLQRGTCCL